MVTLEQVKLLEARVAKAIEFVNRIIGENDLLKGKLDFCQQRIDELESLVEQFKAEQGRIEEGIVSALDRLSRFEQAVIPEGVRLEPASEVTPTPALPKENPLEKSEAEEVDISLILEGESADDDPEEPAFSAFRDTPVEAPADAVEESSGVDLDEELRDPEFPDFAKVASGDGTGDSDDPDVFGNSELDIF
ncbi:MAG: hypothetical protein LBT11_00955 [Treponema sp.]|jgi:hypothetical protein|nr:hypothetical protein [Treponema sp.]